MFPPTRDSRTLLAYLKVWSQHRFTHIFTLLSCVQWCDVIYHSHGISNLNSTLASPLRFQFSFIFLPRLRMLRIFFGGGSGEFVSCFFLCWLGCQFSYQPHILSVMWHVLLSSSCLFVVVPSRVDFVLFSTSSFSHVVDQLRNTKWMFCHHFKWITQKSELILPFFYCF